MMRQGRTALYYPTIDIPTDSWLRQAVCYWDQVGSIVPRDYDHWADEQAIQRYVPDIQYLYEEEVFRPFNPDSLVQRDFTAVREFTQELNATINSPRFRKLLPTREKRERNVQVYQQKVTSIACDFLERKKLVERRPNDPWFYYFEQNTALVYMSLLAKYLARSDGGITVPSTDQEVFQQLNFHATRKDDASIALSTSMKNILPVPSNDVSFKTILKFKKQYRQQLLDFRSEIDTYQSAVQSCEDIRLVGEENVRFREKMEREVSRLEVSMRKSRISTVFGSLQSFIKPTSPALVGATAMLAGQATSLTTLPVTWLISGAVGAGVIEVAAHLIKKSEEKADAFSKSPYSYVYLAEKQLGAGFRDHPSE